MDSCIVEAVARKNIARFRALLRSPIGDEERRGLLKLLADEQRKLTQLRYDAPPVLSCAAPSLERANGQPALR